MPHKIAQLESQLIRAALDAAHVGLLVVDSTGHLVIVNETARVLLGRELKDLVGQPYQLLLGTGLHVARFREVFSTEAAEIACDGRVPHPRHGQALVLFQARSFTTSDGDVFRSVAVIDVSDFGVSRDQFIALRRQLDQMGSAVVITDARAPDQPICYVNAAFERMTGYSAREAIGRNCRFLQRVDRDQAELQELRRALDQHAACTVTLRNYRRDGTPFLNELFISPLFDEHGELTHYLGVQRVAHARVAPAYDSKESLP